MKASAIYLKAAELTARPHEKAPGGLASCWAIGYAKDPVSPSSWGDEQDRYSALFRPDANGALGGCWIMESDELEPDERQPWRTLALLFMHQIALDEEGRK